MSKLYNPSYDYDAESFDRDYACFYNYNGTVPSYCLWSGHSNKISLESNVERISWWKQFRKHSSGHVRDIANRWIENINSADLNIISLQNTNGYSEILPNIMGENYENLPLIFRSHLNCIGSFNIYQGSYDVTDIPLNIIKQIIGRDGCYFKMTTRNFKIHFMWYDKNTKKIEFWGNPINIFKAYKFTKNRINKYN